MARQFFALYCELATCDGEMSWAEREWLEMLGTFAMIEPRWFMDVLERECPCSNHPLARK